MTNIIFSSSPRAIQDVVVAGWQVIRQGRHPWQEEIVRAFQRVQQRLGAKL
jgi:hypothetical protein